MAKIEFLTSWDGYFVVGENTILDDIEEVYEYYWDERKDDDLPEYVHIGREDRGMNLMAKNIVEDYLDAHEHAETNYDLLDNEKAMEELQGLLDNALERWSYKNTICTIWEEPNMAVKLDWDAWQKKRERK